MKYTILLVLCALFSNPLTGQLPVHEEPLHKVIYEDAEIRILEINAAPGDTSLLHQHDYNYCYLATQGGKLWLEDLGEESRHVDLPTHYVGGKFELSEGPFVHRFANRDSSTISFFTIEHKSGLAKRAMPVSLPDDTVLTSKLFTVRRLDIASLSSHLLPHEGTAVLLNLSPSPLLCSDSDPIPYWRRFGAKEAIQVSNMQKAAISIAVFEIY